MTLIVAMKAEGAIILAADSRATIGDPRGLTAINDSQTKLFPFGRCGLGIAGASEMGSALLDELRKRNLEKPSTIDGVVHKVASESADLFRKWFPEIQVEKRPGVLMTLAGFRTTPGAAPEPMIYMLNSQASFAPQLFGSLPALSGVPQYAIYLMNRYYDPAISVAKAKALAEYLISETASQDPKVGGPIRIAEISSQNGYRELSSDEVQQISQANAALNQRLRRFFLEADLTTEGGHDEN